MNTNDKLDLRNVQVDFLDANDVVINDSPSSNFGDDDNKSADDTNKIMSKTYTTYKKARKLRVKATDLSLVLCEFKACGSLLSKLTFLTNCNSKTHVDARKEHYICQVWLPKDSSK